jgi:hypothetical protein
LADEALPYKLLRYVRFAGSVLLSSVQICVICGNFGCNEAQIEKESRYAQFEARPESYPQRCAHNIEKLHRGI